MPLKTQEVHPSQPLFLTVLLLCQHIQYVQCTQSAMRGHTEYSMSEQAVFQEVHDGLFKYTGDAVVLLVSSSLAF